MNNAKTLEYATEALQAQERLKWDLECTANFFGEMKSNAYSCLEALTSQKAYLEGSDAGFKLPLVNQNELTDLKLLTLMHIPLSVTADVKKKFTAMVEKLLKDQCSSIISITLLTCPWYQLSKRERGKQAKHNILLVIFMSHDDQFFAPVNFQVKEKASVIDLGWFCAVELSHFGQALCRGRTRYLEAMYCGDGAQIYTSSAWLDLRDSLSYLAVTGTRGFLEACLGQAVAGAGKKSKTHGMILRESTSSFKICESFRLLQLADNTLRLKSCCIEVKVENLPEAIVPAVIKIKSLYDHTEPLNCKQELFDLLMVWAKDLRSLLSSVNPGSIKSNQTETQQAIGEWLLKTRLGDKTIRPCPALPDSHIKLQELIKNIGGHVARLQPEHILLVAVAGSAMYNLSTPSSDVDYIVIYTIPTENMLVTNKNMLVFVEMERLIDWLFRLQWEKLMSGTNKLPECYENRGVEKSVEYGAYEASTFCEMLLKCSVVILELLFKEEHEYMSPLWQELANQRQKFVTEKAISQYLGLIKNNLKFIGKGKHSGFPKKERKLYYQNFHKIHCVQHMIKGEVPPVSVSGDIKEFIMNVRTQDQGEWSRENVLVELKKWYRDLRESLSMRTHRLRENPDYQLCADWLLSVRGLSLKGLEHTGCYL